MATPRGSSPRPAPGARRPSPPACARRAWLDPSPAPAPAETGHPHGTGTPVALLLIQTGAPSPRAGPLVSRPDSGGEKVTPVGRLSRAVPTDHLPRRDKGV